jgi:hypothetical protein
MTDCLLCTTPPASASPAFLRSHCRCGFELKFHGWGHPHSYAVVECMEFEAGVTHQELPRKPTAQLALLAEVSPTQAALF